MTSLSEGDTQQESEVLSLLPISQEKSSRPSIFRFEPDRMEEEQLFPAHSTWEDVKKTLFQAVRSGNLSKVKDLLDDSPSLLESRDDLGRSLLEVSVIEEESEMTSWLLEIWPCSATYRRSKLLAEILGLRVIARIFSAQEEVFHGSILQKPVLSGLFLGLLPLLFILGDHLDLLKRLHSLGSSFQGIELALPGFFLTWVLVGAFTDSHHNHTWGERPVLSKWWFFQVFLGILLGFELLDFLGFGGAPGYVTFMYLWVVSAFAILLELFRNRFLL
jgi:hypothetical protein